MFDRFDLLKAVRRMQRFALKDRFADAGTICAQWAYGRLCGAWDVLESLGVSTAALDSAQEDALNWGELNCPANRKRDSLGRPTGCVGSCRACYSDYAMPLSVDSMLRLGIKLEPDLADDLTQMEGFTGLSTATLFSAYAKAMGGKAQAAMYRPNGNYGIAIGEDFWAKEYQRRERLTMKLGKVIEWRLGGNANRPEICMRCGYTFGQHNHTCSKYGEKR